MFVRALKTRKFQSLSVQLPFRQMHSAFSHTNILALELLDKNDWRQLTGMQQIDQLSSHIQYHVKALQTAVPNALNIITWHDDAIKDKHSHTMNPQTAFHYQKTFSDLTRADPSLVIVGGSIVSAKYFPTAPPNLYSEIKQEYGKLVWTKGDQEICKHLAQLERISFKQGIYVVRNTTYIFQQNNSYQHDKTTPFYDTLSYANCMFRPGDAVTEPTVFRLENPFTQQTFSLGVEICREHYLGVLREQMKKNLVPRPTMQFIVSDSLPVSFLGNIAADSAIHVDSRQPARAFQKRKSATDFSVRFFRANAANKKPGTRVGITPVYFLTDEIFTLINRAIEASSNIMPFLKISLETAKKEYLRQYEVDLNEKEEFMLLENFLENLDELLDKMKYSRKLSLGFSKPATAEGILLLTTLKKDLHEVFKQCQLSSLRA